MLLQPVPMRVRVGGQRPSVIAAMRGGASGAIDAQVQVLRLLDVRMPPGVGHLLWKARRRRALLLRLLLVPMLPLGYA